MTSLRLLSLVALVAVSGCGVFQSELDKCHEKREYQEAQPGPRLRVPEDMDALDPEARLELPYGETNVEPTAPDQPCLIEPPSYNDQSRN